MQHDSKDIKVFHQQCSTSPLPLLIKEGNPSMTKEGLKSDESERLTYQIS